MVTSAKEVGVGCLGTEELLEKLSTDVCQQWGIYLWQCSRKSWSFFADNNVQIGIIQKLVIFFWCEFHKMCSLN
jgi:hypothetical protein